MEMKDLKLGHCYHHAQLGTCFLVNTHPHDGATLIVMYHDTAEDEEKYVSAIREDLEYEITTGEIVFPEQYQALELSRRVFQALPGLLAHVALIHKQAASMIPTRIAGTEVHVKSTAIIAACEALNIILERDKFNVMTGVAQKAKHELEDWHNARRYRKLRENAYRFGVGNPTPEELDALLDQQ